MIAGPHRSIRRRGTSLAEAAFAIPVLFTLLFGIFEYGRFFLMKNLIANAAREGARFAVVHTSDRTTADVQSVVTTYLGSAQGQLRNLVIQVYATDANDNPLTTIPWTAAPFGSGIGVQVDADYQPVLPVVLFGLTHLQTAAVMNCEGN